MRRLAVLIAVVLLILLLTCCGSTTMISGALLADNLESAGGLVSLVRLAVASGPDGTWIDITIVTLVSSGLARTLNFCGNQVSQFPPNSFVTATYKPATPCSALSAVIRN